MHHATHQLRFVPNKITLSETLLVTHQLSVKSQDLAELVTHQLSVMTQDLAETPNLAKTHSLAETHNLAESQVWTKLTIFPIIENPIMQFLYHI